MKFSPSLTSSRTPTYKDTIQVEGNGSNFRFALGLIVDNSFSETYAFSTGILFVPKRISFSVDGPHPNTSEVYNLQYLQIPVTLKLYTNEIVPDLSVFFQVGGAPEIKIFEEADKETYTLIDSFKPLDVNVMLGAGVEYRAGINTVLFINGSFQRGLMNIVDSTTPEIGDDFAIRNTVFMFDLGIKF